MQTFTPEELAELAAFDALVDAEGLTQEEINNSEALDKEVKRARYDNATRKEYARHRAYYQANKEKIAAHRRAYLEANKETIAVNRRAYYERKRK